MKKRFSTPAVVAVALLAWGAPGAQAKPKTQGAAAPPAAASPAPSTAAAPAAAKKPADPRTEALLDWFETFFPYGPGETTVEEVAQFKIPHYRFLRLAKQYSVEPKGGDQTYAAVDDDGKTVIVGEAFADQVRMKSPAPVKTDADLASLRDQLKNFLRGSFKLVLDPANDRRSFKAVKIICDTGYGSFDIGGFVKADDGVLLLLGRAWDMKRPLPEQRKALIKLADTPSTGPADAKVTIVEFSDMQCPYCKKRTLDWEKLTDKIGKELKIRRYFKQFPLYVDHPWAFRASSAGRCFYETDPNLFLRWKSQVYQRQDEMNVGALDSFALDFAAASEMGEQKFKACYLQPKASERILQDLNEGFAIRVRTTPTYFVDGVPVSWFNDNLMEEYLRKTYLKGAGLPLPTPPAPKGTPAAPAGH